jgi:hypothetical protein
MKITHIALALALTLAGASPALAANDTVTVTLTTQAATCSGGCSKTLNGPSGVNLLAKIVATYQQPCNTSINSLCTPAQVVAYWVSKVGQNLQADILAYDTAAAQAAANNAVTAVVVQ